MDRMMSLQSIDYEIDDEYVINKADLELYNEFESMEVLVPADIDLDDASQKIKFVNEKQTKVDEEVDVSRVATAILHWWNKFRESNGV